MQTEVTSSPVDDFWHAPSGWQPPGMLAQTGIGPQRTLPQSIRPDGVQGAAGGSPASLASTLANMRITHRDCLGYVNSWMMSMSMAPGVKKKYCSKAGKPGDRMAKTD